MTVMQFDPHRGWTNPNPDFASRHYRADAPISRPASKREDFAFAAKEEHEKDLRAVRIARARLRQEGRTLPERAFYRMVDRIRKEEL